MSHRQDDEEQPLLRPDVPRAHSGACYTAAESASQTSDDSVPDPEAQKISFGPKDESNPKAWSKKKKLVNVAIIALMAILTPLASSMFTPGIAQIAQDLRTDEQSVIATTTGFVIMSGFGPLVLAPFSETFGRRVLYIWCFAVFTVLQIGAAVSPNVGTLIGLRAVSGFFGSKPYITDVFPANSAGVRKYHIVHVANLATGVGLANGGGTISDMYEPSQRAGVFGWYLLGPLLGKFDT